MIDAAYHRSPSPAAPAGRVVAARRRAKRRSRRAPRPNIFILNLTPLLDCVFMLLLFLIVATRFTTPEGFLTTALPGRSTAGADAFEVPRVPIRIYLSAEPGADAARIRLDTRTSEPITRTDLAPALSRYLRRPGVDKRTPVYLLAADDIPWDDVVNAYNAALAASFERIHFVEPSTP
jgi:biopolymer transport protein ExbD